MTTGKFKADASLRNTSTSSWNQVFSGSQRLTSASAILTDNNGNVERYIFPTRENSETFTTTSTDAKNNSLGIQISLSNGNSFTYWTKEIAMNASNQPLKSGDDYLYKPFQFDPNYQYDVLLTVTSKALVVTLLPRYYGWIPKDESQSNTTALTEIGNPVTFGGVVWADRNLGATSADPTKSEMDWERARGWDYQFGGSIPYYIKGSMQDPNHIDDKELVSFINGSSYNTTSNNVPMCEAANHASNSRPYPYVINHYGEGPIMFSNGNAYDASYSDPKNHLLSLNSEYDASSKLAKMPDESSLKFNFTYQLGEPVDYDFNHGTSAVFWNTDSNLPCPKGWRLPTYNEFLTIYPSVEKVGNIAFNSSYQSTVTSEKFKTSGTDTYYDKLGSAKLYNVKTKKEFQLPISPWHNAVIINQPDSNSVTNPCYITGTYILPIKKRELREILLDNLTGGSDQWKAYIFLQISPTRKYTEFKVVYINNNDEIKELSISDEDRVYFKMN